MTFTTAAGESAQGSAAAPPSAPGAPSAPIAPTREDRFQAESIIRALKLGNVPVRGIDRIVVGRDREADQLRRDLDYTFEGGGGVKFLSGDYGSGKTFMCSLVREAAWSRNMAVSVVDLGRNASLARFEGIYHHIMQGLRTRDLPSAPAFGYIVQQWLYTLEQGVQDEFGLDPLDDGQRDEIAKHVEKRINGHLANVAIFDSSFANAFRGYYAATLRGDQLVADAALGWLRGESNIPTELKGKFRVRGGVTKDNAFAFLKAMSTLICSIGYGGLVVIFDETELVRNLNRADMRQSAYENIKSLLDKTAQGELPRCFFLFAGTEVLFADEQKGIPSYPALHDRIRPRHQKIVDRAVQEVRSPIMVLEGFSRVRLLEVSAKVRDIHGLAYDWEPRHRLDEAFLADLCDSLSTKFGQEARTFPRGFLKHLVDVLDLCEQDATYDPRSDLAVPEQAVAAIKEVEGHEAHLLDF
ncbi:MAG: DUF2791 family P-loop domain-containing protein [Candidatus Sericytochromatia bacterium]|uniref:DUF2791 family P-loop domain-containing protein n=1 Tax=Candidatus Tanganyikabacteria bacterium TaxID=2961651 RepID=A0A937X592_9BACT|nr:DUF2791 family P-loop domain-containing protein [Candidatus Tanganyikabacteria bacterium]